MKRVLCLLVVMLAACTSESELPPPLTPKATPAKAVSADQTAKPVAFEPSAWLTAERSLHLGALAGVGAGHTVVFPFTNLPVPGLEEGAEWEQGEIDLTGRMAMAHIVAARLVATGTMVVDPTVVALAAGEGRALTETEVANMLAMTGARRAVLGAVRWRHPTPNDASTRVMDVSIRRVELTAVSDGRSRNVETVGKVYERRGIPISESKAAEMAFERIVDDALEKFGVEARGNLHVSERPARARIPDVIHAAHEADDSLSEFLWRGLLLASLAPPESDRGRHRLSERLAGTALRLADDSPDKRAIVARNLLLMERRLAALELLDNGSKTPEELGLRALVAGDEPALARVVGRILRPIPRLLAELDLYRLRFNYRVIQDKEAAKELARIVALAPPRLRPMVAWHLAKFDAWNVSPALEVKFLLDAEFPIPGKSAETLLKGKLALGADRRNMVGMEILPFEHIDEIFATRTRELCCIKGNGRTLALEYLLLMRAEAVARMVSSIEFAANIQGRRQDALRLIDDYERAGFQGLPQLALYRATVTSTSVDFRMMTPPIVAEITQAAGKYAHWVSGQDDDMQEAMLALSSHKVSVLDARMRNRIFPMRWKWGFRMKYPSAFGFRGIEPSPLPGKQIAEWLPVRQMVEGCMNVVDGPNPCIELYQWSLRVADERAQAFALEQITDRFKGSGVRLATLAGIRKNSGDMDGAESLYRQALKSGTDQWQLYADLAEILIAKGDIQGATSLILRFPPFHDPQPGNTVGYSNALGGFALQLAARGATDAARKLLPVVLRYNDGSGSNILSRYLDALFRQDYDQALKWSGMNMARYQSMYAARSNASLLFALGRSSDAWGIFEEARRQSQENDVWHAAIVGFRMEAADRDRIAKWIGVVQTPTSGQINMMDLFAAETVAVQLMTVDRSADSAMEVALILPQGKSASGGVSTKDPAIAKRSASWIPDPSGSKLAVATAYAGFKKDDPNAIIEALESHVVSGAAMHFSGPDFMLPGLVLYAYGAAKSGKTEGLDSVLEKYSGPKAPAEGRIPQHDLHMIKGIRAALAGQHSAALQELKLAQANMEPAGSRMLPPGVLLADVCERFAEMSGNQAYLKRALDWVRGVQAIEPWSAWAWSFEALHSRDRNRQVQATGMAMHLDPRSERISRLDKTLRAAGRAWFQANDPFRAPTKSKAQTPQQKT